MTEEQLVQFWRCIDNAVARRDLGETLFYISRLLSMTLKPVDKSLFDSVEESTIEA